MSFRAVTIRNELWRSTLQKPIPVSLSALFLVLFKQWQQRSVASQSLPTTREPTANTTPHCMTSCASNCPTPTRAFRTIEEPMYSGYTP